VIRVLVLTHRLPYAPDRGDRLRVHHMLRHLRERADVELVSFVHDDQEAAHVATMRELIPRTTALRVPRWRSRAQAALPLPTSTPLTHALLDAPGINAVLTAICEQRRPDVVFAYCSGMAKFAMRRPLSDIPFVLDFVDVDSQKWRDLAQSSRAPMSWIYKREAATLGAFEARAAGRAATSLVVNAREAGIARALAPAANVQVIANGVELDRLRPLDGPSTQPRVVFCGVMSYAPNAEGMTWFVREVWPLVRARRPDATLAVVGPDPSAAFRSLCAADPSITVAGRVPDVRDWLWQSAVGIAPLHVARGVQNKALEAIAAGLPIVITEAVAGGLPPEAASASLVANTPEPFADHVLRVLAMSPQQRRQMAATADFSALSWPRTLEQLWPIIERAARPISRTLRSESASCTLSVTTTDLSPDPK
jgi:sugar transferase (PEP-CTERM/EpsH1 system associated)